MKNTILTTLLVFFFLSLSQAQENKLPKIQKKPHLIIGTGIGFQWFENAFKYGSLMVEVPVGQYQHLGIQVNRVFERSNRNYDYYEPILDGSYEVSIYGKYFLHGRFTGRKSGFYMGPDISFGVRNYGTFQYNPQLPSQYELITQKYKTSKIMLCWGVQWLFGKHTVFEISVPMGYENIDSAERPIYSGYTPVSSGNTFVLLPTIILGLAF